MKEALIQEYKNTINRLETVIRLFTEAQFNKVPFENSWTPAQVADHIYKSQADLSSLVNGNTIAADRDPEEKQQAIKDVFLNFDIRFQSPDYIIPRSEPIPQEEMLDSIAKMKAQNMEGFSSADVTRICTDFEVPGFGPFTGMEWAWFAVYHSQRHIHQLEKIHTIINN